jgi:hypothetical protein
LLIQKTSINQLKNFKLWPRFIIKAVYRFRKNITYIKPIRALELLQKFSLNAQLACAEPLLLNQHFENKTDQYIKSKLNKALLEEIRFDY